MLEDGTCVRCLLNQGLAADGELSREEFIRGLQDDELPATEWRLGNYEILEEVGRGGMGVIYRARQRHSRRIVALKQVLGAHAHEREWKERFRREAEAVASLDHPNVLPIYEVNESQDGLAYFSMKWASGGSLRHAGAALSANPRECVRLMAKVARAVEHAHERGILHRDLQPGNILLDSRGEPMVCDFGLAKWLDGGSDLTRTLTSFGTPGYIAPEQAEGPADDLKPTADVYSLGAVLFNLLASRPPFLGSNALSVIRQAASSDSPKLSSLIPSVDRDLETITAHCLEREPAARYQSAGALAADLESWLAHRPIQARRASVPAKVWRWARRNSMLAATGSGCLLLPLAIGWLLMRGTFSDAPALTPEKSIAVLPFENLNLRQNDAFFADGVQDDVLTALAKIADLKVIARTSVMGYQPETPRDVREIGRALGVAHILEGSVRCAGTRVRVNAQLVDTRTNANLWAESYDRDLTDVFAIQSEIAHQIARALRATLSSEEKSALDKQATKDVEAFNLYSRARTLRLTATFGAPFRGRLGEVVKLLDEAVGRDPAFLPAWCELGAAHDILYFAGYDHTGERRAAAEAAIQKALRLDPESGAAHLALAQHLYRAARDYDGARSELEKARATLPNNAEISELIAYIDRRQGRWVESTRGLERAIDLDPRNAFTLGQTSLNYIYLRRYPEAASVLDRAVAIAPEQPLVRISRAWVDYEERGDLRPLHATIDEIRGEGPAATATAAADWVWLALCERDPTSAETALRLLTSDDGLTLGQMLLSRSFGEGLVARVRGDAATAQAAFARARVQQEEIVRAQPDFGPPLCVLGLIDAALGRKQDALKEGRRALELMPLEKDALQGADALQAFAIICAWSGESEMALQYLERGLSSPSLITYGQLKLHPWWDPLRGDSRFDAIVDSLRPQPTQIELAQIPTR